MAFVGWRKFWCFYHYSPKCIFTCGLFPQDMLVTGAVAVGAIVCSTTPQSCGNAA